MFLSNRCLNVSYRLKFINLPAISSFYGINSLDFRERLLCNSLPNNAKQNHTLEEFKLKLKNLGNIHRTCVVFSMSVLSFFNASYVLRLLHVSFFIVGI